MVSYFGEGAAFGDWDGAEEWPMRGRSGKHERASMEADGDNKIEKTKKMGK